MSTLYEKRGRRYHPVAEHWYDVDTLPTGAHLVIVKPGFRTTHYNVDPDYAAVLAAISEHEDELTALLHDAYQARSTMPDDARMKAWQAWLDAGGRESITLQWPSVASVVAKFRAAVIAKAAQKELASGKA